MDSGGGKVKVLSRTAQISQTRMYKLTDKFLYVA